MTPANPYRRLVAAAEQACEEYQILIALSGDTIVKGYQKSCLALHEALAALPKGPPTDGQAEQMAEFLLKSGYGITVRLDDLPMSDVNIMLSVARAVLMWHFGGTDTPHREGK